MLHFYDESRLFMKVEGAIVDSMRACIACFLHCKEHALVDRRLCRKSVRVCAGGDFDCILKSGGY